MILPRRVLQLLVRLQSSSGLFLLFWFIVLFLLLTFDSSGLNFGPDLDELHPKVYFDTKEVEVYFCNIFFRSFYSFISKTASWGDDTIKFEVPAGVGKDKKLKVSIGEQDSEEVTLFSYESNF